MRRLFPLLVLTAAASAAPQDFPGTPRVSSVYPAGGQRGTTVEVEFTGGKLLQPKGVVFTNADKIKVVNISAVPADPKVAESHGKVAKATIEIAPDCPTGLSLARLFTEYGIAEVVPCYVGALPTVAEGEPADKSLLNNTPETAQAIEGPSTINGNFLRDDEDLYKIDAKAGQLISAEVECARLAVGVEDGTEVLLSIRDAAGKQIATCDDTPLFLADPFLSIKAPADGSYFVSLKPLLPSNNGRRIAYRLHIGDFLRPAGIYPAGGAPGETIHAKLLGTDQSKDITLPKDLKNGKMFAYRASEATATPNELSLLAGPNAMEQEPNDQPEQATISSGPPSLALNGILEKNGDVDCFKFPAKKGQRLIITGLAQAIGSPADLQIGILPVNAKPGQNPEKSDDVTENELDNFEQTYSRERLDPKMIFSAKEDAEYILTVRDTRGVGSPISVYRIEIAPVEPSILAGMYAPENNQQNARISTHVGKGNRAMFLMNVRPGYGTEKIEGELQVKATNLPNGVTFSAPKFKIDQRRVPILFEAAPDAAVGATMLDLRIEPIDPAAPKLNTRFTHNLGLTSNNGDISTSVNYDRLAFAVTEVVPFKVEVKSPSLPLSKSGELQLDIEVTRTGGYNEAIELGVENAPQGITPQTGVVVKEGETKTTLRLGAESNAPIGIHQLCITARNKTNNGEQRDGKMRATSNLFNVEVSEPYLRIKLARSAIQRGQQATVNATIERIRPLPGNATAKLIRLPKGITMANENIPLPGEGTQFAMNLNATPDALVGTYPNVACEITLQADGREMKQIVGGGTLRIDPARK